MPYRKEPFDIETEYLKNESLKREDVEALRKWVETQWHFPETPDLLLFSCLHSCYYDVDRARSTINSFHSLRSAWPEAFKDRNPRTVPLLPQLDVGVQWPVTQTTKEGYKVFILKLVDSDPSHFDMDQQIKKFFVAADYWTTKLKNCEGFVVILDPVGSTWGHLLKFGIGTARKLMAYVQEASPVRLKGVHFINANALVDKALFISRIFMNKELNAIVFAHKKMDTLYEYVPQSLLPKDYGGNDVTIEELHEAMKKTLTENFKLFLDDGEEFEEVDNFNEDSEDVLDIRL